MVYRTSYASDLVGPITMASDGESLIGLWLDGQKYFLATVDEEMAEDPTLPVFGQARTWLDAYFAGKSPKPSELPLAPRGSEFRQRVWDILVQIPYGDVTTYGQIAQRLAKETGKVKVSAQAVGGAVGHNPISIIIPCHRVVGSTGSLTGYAGGIGKKVRLLELEGAPMDDLFIPTKGTAL